MSASSKKKLRKEQNAAVMTEKQLNEQKEAKTLKKYTWTFVIVMILVVVIAIGSVIRVPITGALDRGSHAVTIGTHKLSTTDLSYYYVDAVNEYYDQAYNTYGSLAPYYMGFSVSSPLDEQKYSSKDYETWADYFIEKSIENAKSIYALYDEAIANGHKLTEEEQESLEANVEVMNTMANLYGYSSGNSYLRATYGSGANLKTYKEYYTVNTIAYSYYDAHSDSIEYTDDEYRAYEKGKFNNYSSYTYATYVVTVNDYLKGGTKSEDGKTTVYSDAEKEAAQKDAKADADKLIAGTYKDLDAFEKEVMNLSINKDKKEVTVTKYEDYLYTNISTADMQRWIGNANRKPGDITSISMTTSTVDEDKNTTLLTTGYTIVYFMEANENGTNLVDVQHILVKYQGGKTDSSGNTTYTDKEKAAAKEKIEAIKAEWESGDATKESFAELAKTKSEDTGSKANGGLYENVYPGQMVENFDNWCFDDSRKPGDTGIVATEYGYHLIYFVETTETTYRDYMIKNAMLKEDLAEWQKGLTEKLTAEKVDLSRMNWAYKLGN